MVAKGSKQPKDIQQKSSTNNAAKPPPDKESQPYANKAIPDIKVEKIDSENYHNMILITSNHLKTRNGKVKI